MRLLEVAFIVSGLFALMACFYYIRQRPSTPHRDSRVATMTGVVFLSAADLALHRVQWLDIALMVVAVSFIVAGLVLRYRRPV